MRKKIILFFISMFIIMLTACGKNSYPALPDNAIAFEMGTFEDAAHDSTQFGTLEYDGRNIAIKKALDLILYLGARIAQPKTKKKNAVDQALMEVERGEIVECSSVDDMFNRLEAAS